MSARGSEGAISRPQCCTWVRVTLRDGTAEVLRFVRLSRLKDAEATFWWIDHGAYGRDRDDVFIRPCAIVSWEPAPRPRWLLSYVDLWGVRQRVGRYECKERAEAKLSAHPLRDLLTEVRIEERPA